MADVKKILQLIKEKEVEFVDFRFTDPGGRWHHTSYIANKVDDILLNQGIMFDGSSIKGCKTIEESDMILLPDLNTAFLDPFTSQATLVIICDIIDPINDQAYIRDPRSVAKRAEAYLRSTNIADTAFFGPELEFFIFDDVRFKISMNKTFVEIDSEEGPYNSGKKFNSGNSGHRPGIKGGYFPVQPVDSLNDIRAEIATMLQSVGLQPTLHHHEVAASQCEVGFDYSTLVQAADNVQKYKYVVHNVANSYGKTATFMPKPVKGDNGSGMHVHQSLWHKGKPLFAGNNYADLSEISLYYIGGIIKHARAINAFTNPSTNSYKRLVSGFEAPILLAYSARNRSAAIRIPYSRTEEARRIEVRFPDPTANPYLAFAALMMAGLDGIANKIHPGDAMDRNLYNLSAEELKNVNNVSNSLVQSLQELEKDHDFLTKGGVFTEDQIKSYIQLKRSESEEVNTTPHPVEFALYYSS